MKAKLLLIIATVVALLVSITVITSATAHHRPNHENKGKPSPTATATPTVTPTVTPTTTATPTPTPTPTVTTTPTATATPTPTQTVTTPPPPPPTNVKPNATNTGVPAGTTLTNLGSPSVPLVITVDGTVIDGKNIYGDIKVQARDVVIKNSRLYCGNYVPTTNSGCIDAHSDRVFNLRVENNTINPTKPHPYRDGIVGHEYTAIGNHVWGTSDGMGAFAKASSPTGLANVRIERNYIHTTVYFDAASDPGPASDGTHNDGIQVQGGKNIRIAWNTIVNDGIIGPGSVSDPNKPGICGADGKCHGHGVPVMLQNNTGHALGNVVVEENWLDNGLAIVVVKPNNVVTVQNNKIGRNTYDYLRDSRVSQYYIRIDQRSTTTVHGINTNRWEDNGQLLVEGSTPMAGIWYNS